MVIHLGEPFIDAKGQVILMVVTGWSGTIFPLCFWVEGIFHRVSRLLDWRLNTKEKLITYLVETSDAIQILIILDGTNKIIDTSHGKVTHECRIYIPKKTSESPDNGEKWQRRQNNSWYQTSYPFVKLSHYTEKSIKPKIESKKNLLPSTWSISGTVKLDHTFCYFTDLEDVKYAWDFFALAMTKEHGEYIFWETDDFQIEKAKVCKVNKRLDDKLDFLIDMRLTLPNPVIEHFKIFEEWWEIFLPNIYRIACSSISLKKDGKFYKIIEDVVNDYKPSQGFLLLSGDDPKNLQNMFNDALIDILI